MKIDQVKKAATLIDRYNEQMKQLKAVESGAMELNFAGYTVVISKSVEDDLRGRVKVNVILDLEKTKSALEELGIEL